jgi:transcriptional regulator with GAF, ATPase, and Fis domain
MKKRNIYYISIFILVPAIFAGISVINFLITYKISAFSVSAESTPAGQVFWWGASISIVTFLCGFFILRAVLNPIMKFIKQAESLPAYPRHALTADQKDAEKIDDLAHISRVFEQITNILSKVEAKELFPEIVGQSKPIRAVFSQILKVAPTDATVLISGESGTGKELIATAVYEHSLRKGKPFVKLNCVAIPEGLLESELFGHEKGAFTGAATGKKGKFELADGGTILLDEIGDMPPATQTKILRVLQEREFERVGGLHTVKVDVRFIAATNKNLPELISNGQFRDDLYHRLNVFSVHVPPLRERRDDIALLVEYFLEKSPQEAEFSAAALNLLIAYDWPGNVRELQNVVERAAVMTESGVIEPGHLPRRIMAPHDSKATTPSLNMSIDDWLQKSEKQMIADALQRAGGIQVQAAELLGINPRSLWHRIKKHGIDAASFKKQQNL